MRQAVSYKPAAGRMSRRAFIGRSAGVALAVGGSSAFLAACGGASGGGSDGSVSVLGFESYIDPTIKRLWSQAYPDITLQGTPAADSGEILTKLRAGGASEYDVVFSDFGYCPIYEREGLAEILDLGTMSAADDLYREFREDVRAFPFLTAPDRAIGFPCQWAPTAMTFNTRVEFVPGEPYSWAQLWSPEIPKGKVGFQGLPPEGFIATAGLAKGIAPDRVYAMDDAELESVVEYFRSIKPFRVYNADPQTQDALRAGNVWASVTPTPGFASRINEESGETITQSVVPAEGAVGFVDGPILVKDAENRENALTFINWFAGDPRVREYIFDAYRAAPCSEVAVRALLDQGGEMARLVTELRGPDPEVATTVVQGQPPARPKAYAAAWDAILA